MYESFFGLSGRPFSANPQASRYFPAEAIEQARRALARNLQRGTGFGLIVGDSGTGKTLLCQVLAEQFRATKRVTLLNRGRLSSRRALYQSLLFELGLPYRGLDEGELRLSLIDWLEGPDAATGLLILADEAHLLPLRLIDELRLLSNIAQGGQPRVQLILAGLPAIEDRLTNPKLNAFNSRLSQRSYLAPFDQQETALYVRSELQACGMPGGNAFSDAALERLHRLTGGVPRLINQVCDYALLLAYAGGARQVPVDGIDEVWADLQHLPRAISVQRDCHQGREDDVIEFGTLDDPADEFAAARHDAYEPSISLQRDDATDNEIAGVEAQLSTIDRHLVSLTEEAGPRRVVGSSSEYQIPAISSEHASGYFEEEVVLDQWADWRAGPRPRVTPRGEERQLSVLLHPFHEPTTADDDLSTPAAHTAQASIAEHSDVQPFSTASTPTNTIEKRLIERLRLLEPAAAVVRADRAPAPASTVPAEKPVARPIPVVPPATPPVSVGPTAASARNESPALPLARRKKLAFRTMFPDTSRPDNRNDQNAFLG